MTLADINRKISELEKEKKKLVEETKRDAKAELLSLDWVKNVPFAFHVDYYAPYGNMSYRLVAAEKHLPNNYLLYENHLNVFGENESYQDNIVLNRYTLGVPEFCFSFETCNIPLLKKFIATYDLDIKITSSDVKLYKILKYMIER